MRMFVFGIPVQQGSSQDDHSNFNVLRLRSKVSICPRRDEMPDRNSAPDEQDPQEKSMQYIHGQRSLGCDSDGSIE